ncbi:MAG TPA: hypothetical protein VI072_22645 [Polyangiaceae bacterium]
MNANVMWQSIVGPPDGVYQPGSADRLLPVEASPQIHVKQRGGEPRVVLRPSPPLSSAVATLFLEVINDRAEGEERPTPVQTELTLQFDASALQEAGATMTATVVHVKSLTGPPDLAPELARLAGSTVAYRVHASGAYSDFRYALASAADPGFLNLMRSASTALATMLVPLPGSALGVGAEFVVATRETEMPIPVVVFRTVRVTSIGDGLVAQLHVETVRYAASADFRLPNVGEDLRPLKLGRFASEAVGSIDLIPGSHLPVRAALSDLLDAELSSVKHSDRTWGLAASTSSRFALHRQ